MLEHDMMRTLRETGRVVQVGVQQRSFDSGLIGDVHMARSFWNANGVYLTSVPPGMEQRTAGLDWNACMGSGWRGGWAR
jgi:hypothetical protein